MIQCYNINSLLRTRGDQAGFHIVAEQHVRIEFRTLEAGATLGPLTYEGDVIITCWSGKFSIESGATTTGLIDLDQAVVPTGTSVTLTCKLRGTIQLIWSPPHGVTRQG